MSRTNMGGMLSRRNIAPGFDPRFGPVFMTGTVDELRARRNVALRPTGYMDRMGRPVFEKITLSPTNASLAPELNPLGLPPPPYNAPLDPYTTNQLGAPASAPAATVGRGGRGGHSHRHGGRGHLAPGGGGAFNIPAQPGWGGGGGRQTPHGARHGHHGGHGGHGGHGRGESILGPGGWGLYDGFPTYELSVCPDGTVQLPDGTCVDASTLNFRTGEGIVATSVAEIPHEVCCHLAGAPMIRTGQSTPPSSQGTFSNTNPSGYVGPGSTGTGANASGNPAADAIDLQWQALAQLVTQNPTTIGPNPTLPMSYSPDAASSSWATDYADWQTYHAQIGTLSLSQITGDNAGWQAYANAWGQYLRTLVPQGTALPQNFPTGPASPLQTVSSLLPSTASVVSTLEWIVIGVAVAAGVWLLWPVLGPRLLTI